MYSLAAVDGAARDRHVEHGPLPHIGLTRKHNGEVCVDSFAVPKLRHGGRDSFSFRRLGEQRVTQSPSARERPLVRGIWHKKDRRGPHSPTTRKVWQGGRKKG